MREILSSLIGEGPTKRAADHRDELTKIRNKYRAWVTKEIEDKLTPFEKALSKLGLDSHMADKLPANDPQKIEALKRAHESFGKIVYLEKKDSLDNSDADKIIENLQTILGINELTRLRQRILSEAIKALDSQTAIERR